MTRIKFIIYGRNVIRLKSRNILIAEDDVNINNLLKEALEREEYDEEKGYPEGGIAPGTSSLTF